jgi:hypothetical protein
MKIFSRVLIVSQEFKDTALEVFAATLGIERFSWSDISLDVSLLDDLPCQYISSSQAAERLCYAC